MVIDNKLLQQGLLQLLSIETAKAVGDVGSTPGRDRFALLPIAPSELSSGVLGATSRAALVELNLWSAAEGDLSEEATLSGVMDRVTRRLRRLKSDDDPKLEGKVTLPLRVEGFPPIPVFPPAVGFIVYAYDAVTERFLGGTQLDSDGTYSLHYAGPGAATRSIEIFGSSTNALTYDALEDRRETPRQSWQPFIIFPPRPSEYDRIRGALGEGVPDWLLRADITAEQIDKIIDRLVSTASVSRESVEEYLLALRSIEVERASGQIGDVSLEDLQWQHAMLFALLRRDALYASDPTAFNRWQLGVTAAANGSHLDREGRALLYRLIERLRRDGGSEPLLRVALEARDAVQPPIIPAATLDDAKLKAALEGLLATAERRLVEHRDLARRDVAYSLLEEAYNGRLDRLAPGAVTDSHESSADPWGFLDKEQTHSDRALPQTLASLVASVRTSIELWQSGRDGDGNVDPQIRQTAVDSILDPPIAKRKRGKRAQSAPRPIDREAVLSLVERLDAIDLRHRTGGSLGRLDDLLDLGERPRQLEFLQASGLQSAADLAGLGEGEFIHRTNGVPGFTPGAARGIHRRAVRKALLATSVISSLRSELTASAVGALRHKETVVDALAQAKGSGVPNLELLFELPDACDCEWELSVWGPDAYLVDLLEFLRNRQWKVEATDGCGHAVTLHRSALEVLLRRRADIQELQLDTANALTELPTIDLICELLEDAVAQCFSCDCVCISHEPANLDDAEVADILARFDLHAEGTPGWTYNDGYLRIGPWVFRCEPAHDAKHWNVRLLRQTTWTTDELKAAPEYIRYSVYDRLARADEARKDLALPFDLAHAEAAEYLTQLGTRRTEVIEIVGFTREHTELHDGESLGMSPAERRAIFDDAAPLHDLWGGKPGDLEKVRTMLDRAQLTYRELAELLELRFIRGDRRPRIVEDPEDTCDTKEMRIVDLDPSVLDRLDRFIRLWRKLGWSPETLDAIIRSGIGQGKLGAEARSGIASIARIAALTGSSPSDIAASYTGIPWRRSALLWNKSRVPLHDRLFFDPRARRYVDAALDPERLIVVPDDGADDGSRDRVEREIAAAFSIPQAQLQRLGDELVVHWPLNTGGLGALYGAKLLGSMLVLPPDEVWALLRLVYGRPCRDAVRFPEETERLIAHARWLSDAGMKPSELLYLLRHEGIRIGEQEIHAGDLEKLRLSLSKAIRDIRESKPTIPGDDLQPSTRWEAFAPLFERLRFDPEARDSNELVFGETALSDDELRDLGIQQSTRRAVARTIALGDYFHREEPCKDDGEWRRKRLQSADSWLRQRLENTLNEDEFDELGRLLAAIVAAIDHKPEETKVAKSDPVEGAVDDFLEWLWGHVTEVLEDQQIRSALITVPAASLKHDAELVELLLEHEYGGEVPLGQAILDAIDRDEVKPLIRRLAKASQFAQRHALTAEELEWLCSWEGRPRLIRLEDLAYGEGARDVDNALEAWKRFYRSIALARSWKPVRDPDSGERYSFLQFLEDAKTAGNEASRTWLSTFSGWPTDLLEAVEAAGVFGGPSYADSLWLEKIGPVIDLLRRRLQLPLSTVLDLAGRNGRETFRQQEVTILRQALRVRFERQHWLALLEKIQNRLRPQKRDALVAWLSKSPGFAKAIGSERPVAAADMTDHFLIDVQKGACASTSRIVEAHSSVQRFVTRCLMGLEPDVKHAAEIGPDGRAKAGWRQWEWLKNYRVWEASRKIYLYPENWIEPELRDDKSEFFKELEVQIGQGELTRENLERAVRNYLEKLFEIALPEVRTTYYDAQSSDLHVVARTRGGKPVKYFHRTRNAHLVWSPWKRINLEINSEHVLVFRHNGRLRLAWLMLEEEANRTKSYEIPKSSGGGSTENPEARVRVSLAMSEFDGHQWTAPRISPSEVYYPVPGKDPIYAEGLTLPLVSRFIRLQYHELPEGLLVVTLDKESELVLGRFLLGGCKGYPDSVAGDDRPVRHYPRVRDAEIQNMRFAERTSRDNCNTDHGIAQKPCDTLEVVTGIGSDDRTLLLRKTPTPFVVTTIQSFNKTDGVLALAQRLMAMKTSRPPLYMGAWNPLFYEDRDRAYVFLPVESTQVDCLRRPVAVRSVRAANALLAIARDLAAAHVAGNAEDPSYGERWERLVRSELGHSRFITLMLDCMALQRPVRLWAENFYHPTVCPLIERMQTLGVEALYTRAAQQRLDRDPTEYKSQYDPAPIFVNPDNQFPQRDVDFSRYGAYASYNWEIFFHIPFSIAVRLSRAGKFDEARRWFEYIFDPTAAIGSSDDGGSTPDPSRYWITRPFAEATSVEYHRQRIDILLKLLSGGGPKSESEHEAFVCFLRDQLDCIDEMRFDPFNPHLIARHRSVAFQKAVVMRYLDNLLAWGDHLFRQFTRESVNEAAVYYEMALRLLGPRPKPIPRRKPLRSRSYSQLRRVPADPGLESALSGFDLQYDEHVPPEAPIAFNPYFCAPFNEQLLGYWDKVQDRLDKIRRCLDIDGVPRSLALFAPPIDPAALVRAAAAGLDISEVLAGLNQPLPFYRFAVYQRKALELAQEVRNLGASLLSVLERKDAEVLARLRTDQEKQLLALTRQSKRAQIEEARKQIEGLTQSIAAAQLRLGYYESREEVSGGERESLNLTQAALVSRLVGQILEAASGAAASFPDYTAGGSGFGGSPHIVVHYGGKQISSGLHAAGTVLQVASDILQTQGGVSATMAGYRRRKEEWDHQRDVTRREISQLEKQLAATEIRLTIYENDLSSHEKQIENAQKVDEYYRGKYSNQELYSWMESQIRGVYYQAYQAAFNAAKKAERCFLYEIDESPREPVRADAWDDSRSGLLAADKLVHDIQRLDLEYLERNRPQYEINQAVSLRMLDPEQLLALRRSGRCEFEVPESFFDIVYPGQYRRRLKAVSMTIPCVVGPYTSVGARLTLLESRYRQVPTSANYAEAPPDDGRFQYRRDTPASIVTSGAVKDYGRFELNLRDERYLPFEGCGAISSWRIELPDTVRTFDYESIEDVILNLQYTAQDGGEPLRREAEEHLKKALNDENDEPSMLAVSLRRDNPDAWAQLVRTHNGVWAMRAGWLPFAFAGKPTTVESAQLYLVPTTTMQAPVGAKANDHELTFTEDDGAFRAKVSALELGGELKLVGFDAGSIRELILLVSYAVDVN